MTIEKIEEIRKIVIPVMRRRLLEVNHEGQGEQEALKFRNDFNELMDFAIRQIEHVTPKAKWIQIHDPVESSWICSHCLDSFNQHKINSVEAYRSATNYCPACGYKMQDEPVPLIISESEEV